MLSAVQCLVMHPKGKNVAQLVAQTGCNFTDAGLDVCHLCLFPLVCPAGMSLLQSGALDLAANIILHP